MRGLGRGFVLAPLAIALLALFGVSRVQHGGVRAHRHTQVGVAGVELLVAAPHDVQLGVEQLREEQDAVDGAVAGAEVATSSRSAILAELTMKHHCHAILALNHTVLLLILLLLATTTAAAAAAAAVWLLASLLLVLEAVVVVMDVAAIDVAKETTLEFLVFVDVDGTSDVTTFKLIVKATIDNDHAIELIAVLSAHQLRHRIDTDDVASFQRRRTHLHR